MVEIVFVSAHMHHRVDKIMLQGIIKFSVAECLCVYTLFVCVCVCVCVCVHCVFVHTGVCVCTIITHYIMHIITRVRNQAHRLAWAKWFRQRVSTTEEEECT